MNILKGTRCYLAGNIEYTSDKENWRNEITEYLNTVKVKVLNPLNKIMDISDITEDDDYRNKIVFLRENGCFNELSKIMKGVIQRDLRAIDLSDFIIVKLEPNKPTFGTIHEIVVASEQHKAIFTIIDSIKTLPFWLFGLLDKDLICKNVMEICDLLDQINNGRYIPNSDYWRLLTTDLR